MSDFFERIQGLSPKRLALLAVELNDALEAERSRGREPIAVVGIGCRFPGAPNPAAYWRLLSEGREAIRDVPADRWDVNAWYDPDPDAPGKISARAGGFLDKVDGFDAAFFGISPREALTMDPQQRLLLEVSWEALEHAGIAPESLRGEACGVFVGVCNNDHFLRVIDRGPEAIDVYLASGNASSVIAGRVSYVLGLNGPALAIDTACSSSLVALQAACQSLRGGQSDVALAGGVNIMCSPETTIALSKAHMLAPDGRCKTFDASADGFARGEGCGVVVLKRLRDAEESGDRILAVIRGVGANQDGRSSGLTVPNGPAQEAVIRAALADAGVTPSDIDYVEAHGTGTTLGDPIEVRALAGALGPGRDPARPLLIGSVKTNFGHLESAAGIAGVIKVILSLQGERIPRHLNFREPSPHIAWGDYPVRVVADGAPWPRGARPRRAGVSSFGFSGTNAHVVLEEAPVREQPARGAVRPMTVIPVSARTDAALRAACASLATVLEQPDADLAAIAHTAGVGRSHLAERVAVLAATAREAAEALRSAASGAPHPALHRGTARGDQVPDVVFLYTGQGAQYPGMAAELYQTSPVFRDVIDRCDAILGERDGRTLRGVLFDPPGESPLLHQTNWTQPALFALEYGLTELWRSWGVSPAAVIGHSVGEYVAACAAGVFDLETGLRLIAERGALMHRLPPGGAMAAVFAPEAEVAAVVKGFPGVAVAAINAPDNTVIAGASSAVDAVLAAFATRNVQGQRLFVSLAAHSPLTEPILDGMEACAASVTMTAPRIPVAWNVTGTLRLPSGTTPDAKYWRRHLREPVRFADGVGALRREGYRAFLEVGPHPTLMALAQRSVPGDDVTWLTSLRRNKPDWPELLASLAALYVRGARIDWAGFDRPYAPGCVELPTYPFERKRYWIDPVPPGQVRGTTPVTAVPGNRLATAEPVFELLLGEATPPWLAQHRVLDHVVVPAPFYLDWIQAAAREAFGPSPRVMEDVAICSALMPGDSGRVAQLSFTGRDGGLAFRIHSRPANGGAWQLHVTGTLRARSETARQPVAAAGAGRLITGSEFYERLARLGIAFGPVFRPVVRGWLTPAGAMTELQLDASVADDRRTWIHPALLDGVLQSIGFADDSAEPQAGLLTGIGRVELDGPVPAELRCAVRVRERPAPGRPEWRADVDILAADGRFLGALSDVRVRPMNRAALEQVLGASAPVPLYELAWHPVPVASAEVAPADIGQLTDAATRAFAELAPRHRLDSYDTILPALDELSAGHVHGAFRALGFDDSPGRTFMAADEAVTLRVVPRHVPLFRRLLGILAEDGVLDVVEPGRYRVRGSLGRPHVAAETEALRARVGENDAELSMLTRAGPELARVLRGDQDPLHLLFPGGSFAEARRLYIESPFARTNNGAILAAMQALVAGLPAGRRLRVIEIGAGTGGTTSYLLPELAPVLDYTFTDVSPLFLARASERFAGPAFRTALLDIEKAPASQGIPSAAYDVVIAANVLHATADLAQTLANVRSLLAPGGTLLLLEGVVPERWVDLTFGLTEGWWRFADHHLRPRYPLLTREAWLSLLEASGFDTPVVLPREAKGRAARQQVLLLARAPTSSRRRITLVRDQGGVADKLAVRLAERGNNVSMVEPGASSVDGDLVYLSALDLDHIPSSPADVARCEQLAMQAPVAHLARAVNRDGRVWLVTAGAQPVAPGEKVTGAAQAPLWGLGRVFSLEHPEQWGGLVDLDPAATLDANVDAIIVSLDGRDDEDQATWRNGSRLVPRLARAMTPGPAALALRSDGAYLVTGGLGGLGSEVGQWLARHGAGTLVLLGRNPGNNPAAAQAVQQAGARAVVVAGDVADEAAMNALFARFGHDLPPLRGIVHAAADFSSAPVEALTAEQVHRMASPKIGGAVLLERLARSQPLEFLVCFSSSTAILGAAGFAHYAAANRFLDAFAVACDRPDRRVLSVNWGTWEVMRSVSEEARAGYRRAGLEPMAVPDALDALQRLLGTSRSGAMVARVDWPALIALFSVRRTQPLLSALDAPPASPVAPQATLTLADDLRRRPPGERRDVLSEFVTREVRAVLGIPPDEPVPPATGLFELGMDSLMSVELKRRLDAGTGRTLPSTLTFNYPSVAALAGFLDEELSDAAEEPVAVRDPGDDAGTVDDVEARLRAKLAELM